MSILSSILGNASKMNIDELQAEFAEILAPGEQIETAFKVIRDKWVFTTRRLILLNVQGLTGSKREYHSIPYGSIVQFCIETAGTFDDDCEMKIWVKGNTTPLVKEFRRGTNLKEIQRVLASHIL